MMLLQREQRYIHPQKKRYYPANLEGGSILNQAPRALTVLKISFLNSSADNHCFILFNCSATTKKERRKFRVLAFDCSLGYVQLQLVPVLLRLAVYSLQIDRVSPF